MSAALQMGAGLAIVLAAIAAAAWLARRLGAAAPAGRPGVLHAVATLAVGPKERVVIVEIGGQWLALGVAPGQVRSLGSFERMELPQAAAPLRFDFRELLKGARERAHR